MATLKFPSNPVINQSETFDNTKYVFDGEKWKSQGLGYNPFLDSKVISREALRRTYAEAGYNLVDGSFEEGGTLTAATDVLLQKSTGAVYAWTGAYPVGGYGVAPGTDPTAVAGYASHTGVVLRSQLASSDGADLIGSATYAQIRAYTGAATKIKCLGREHIFDGASGEFALDASDTTSPDDSGYCLVDAVGRRWKRSFAGDAELLWWCKSDYDPVAGTGTDNHAGIEAAIKFSAANLTPVHVTDGKYYSTKPLNFNSVAGDIRNAACFYGDHKPDIFAGSGAIFYVDSGAGMACLESIDSYHCNAIGIGLCAVGSTSLCAVLSRGTYQTGPGHHLLRDCVGYCKSPEGTNNGVGSIGLLNVACEETLVDNCDWWAALPYAGVHKNEVNVAAVNASGEPTGLFNAFSYSSYYGAQLVSVSSSNTVFGFVGQGRLIAINFQSPNALLETASDVDFGHTFMQRVLDPADPSAVRGKYEFGIQLREVWGVDWHGTIEHCDSLLLNLGTMDRVNLDATLGSESAILSEIYFYEPAAGDRDVRDCNITIRGIYPKKPVICKRNTSGFPLFKLYNSKFSTRSDNTLSFVDAGWSAMLYGAKCSSIAYAGKRISADSGIFEFTKRHQHSGGDILFSVYQPDTGATGAFYVAAKADCLTNCVAATQAASSSHSSVNEWLSSNSNTGFGPNNSVKTVAGLTVNLAPSVTSITAVAPTTIADAGQGRIDYVLSPTVTGSSIQPIETEASVKVIVCRRDGYAAIIF